MKYIANILAIATVFFLGACSIMASEASEKEPEKNYYHIIGFTGEGGYGNHMLVNYNGDVAAVLLKHVKIAPDVTSLVGSCMYGYKTANREKAAIVKCPENMNGNQ